MSLVRAAEAGDAPQLLSLWALLIDDGDTDPRHPWKTHAREWFMRVVYDRATACFPVIDVGGEIVSTAIGTLELGVPNPQCPRGRTVRLANVVTLPEHRANGYGTLLVQHVIEWARSIDADRIDLSTTPDGQRIYERAGFGPTKAPRMKLVL